MTMVVTGCKDCPFLFKEISCKHKGSPRFIIKKIITQNEVAFITPDWCPLKKESITIEMEKK